MNHYEGITVSPLNVDFSKISVFTQNWFDLLVRITRAIHPPFEIPQKKFGEN